MLGHKTSLNKFKKIEIISRNFCDHNALRLETKKNKKQNPAKQKNKHMEAKQYANKQPVSHRRNQRLNQKIP